MEVSVGEFDGRFLIFSLAGKVIPAGYSHLTTLEIDSLEANECEPGSFGLIEGVVSDINVS